MSTTPRVSLRSAVNASCRACIYEPGQRGMGGFREQVVDCVSVICPLHPVRPVPRNCVVGGRICPDKIRELRAKLDERRRKATR